MEKTYKPSINMWQLDCDEAHILHRRGSDDYTEIRHAHVRPDDVDNWEALSVGEIPPYTEAEYKAKVRELIALRYPIADEIALMNNSMMPATADVDAAHSEQYALEYAAYQSYREECKRKAKELLSKRSE